MTRRTAMSTVLAFYALPAVIAAAEAVRYHVAYHTNGVIVSSGARRTFLLHVPPSYDASRPTPLVISLHGAVMFPGSQRDVSRWNAVADREGFLVVYPAGLDNGPRMWETMPSPGLEADVRFIADLLDTLQATYHIDPDRIYADGLSNGGGMAFVLSCTLRNRIAAFGMVAAALLVAPDWCPDSGPAPLLAVHGTGDPITLYGGGHHWSIPVRLPPVRDFVDTWARRNGCTMDGPEYEVAPQVVRRSYDGCADGADVVLVSVQGGGHTWPGGGPIPGWFAGPTHEAFSATAALWAFYETHPRR